MALALVAVPALVPTFVPASGRQRNGVGLYHASVVH
jgi:hypothetical protein